MNKQHQKSTTTKYNRYPTIFSAMSKIFKNKMNVKILSFGCSYGDEVDTLSEMYFPDAEIHGVDIDPEIIKHNNNKKNNNKKIKYYTIPPNVKYHIIFAMSVLCKWPETNDPTAYPVTDFDAVLNDLDKYLEVNSYLVIYNSKYIFTESPIAKYYEPITISDKNINTGFVRKYHRDGSRSDYYPYCVFRKIENTTH
jgi:hypothetical protein